MIDIDGSTLPTYLRASVAAVPDDHERNRLVVYLWVSLIFGPLAILAGVGHAILFGPGHVSAWMYIAVGTALLVLTRFAGSRIQPWITGAITVLVVASSTYTMHSLPTLGAGIGGLTIVIVLASLTESPRRCMVIGAACVAAVLLLDAPELLLPGSPQDIPVGAEKSSRAGTIAIVAALGVVNARSRDRALRDVRERLATNSELAADVQAARTQLTQQVADRTHSLQAQSRDLEAVKRELRAALDRETELAEQLRIITLTDHLTGLANRRRLVQMLQEAPAGSWIMIGDIDHFKTINDTYGHLAGDAVLKRVADTIHQRHQPTARIGGEEFAVLLPPCDADQAYRQAEGIRTAIRDLHWPQLAAEHTPVTISLGLARLSGQSGTVMGQADEAMYQAKQLGRDRVVASQARQDSPEAAAHSGSVPPA